MELALSGWNVLKSGGYLVCPGLKSRASRRAPMGFPDCGSMVNAGSETKGAKCKVLTQN